MFKHFNQAAKKINYGGFEKVSKKLNVKVSTLTKLWNRARARFPLEGDVLFLDMSQNRKNCGRKVKVSSEVAIRRLSRIPPLDSRCTS